MPPKKAVLTGEIATSDRLVDIPCSYLIDRSEWQEFKTTLVDCGLSWNLPDWMTTIVYKGKEWESIRVGSTGIAGVDLSAHFAPPTIQVGEEKKEKPNLVALLGLPKNMKELQHTSTLFCNLATIEYEPSVKLPARQKMWNWIVKSLKGPRAVPGPFHYLVDEAQVYDISYLFKRLCQVLDQITICSLDDELENVIKMDYKPKNQNLFSYFSDLRKAVRRLHDLNEALPDAARIVLPDSYLRSRLVRAARQEAVFKPVIDRLLIMDVAEWSVLTADCIISLRQCARMMSL